MITQAELDEQARLLDVTVSNVERDYLFGWLLAGVFASELGQAIILKGGNALRKGYLPTSRFSDDLDFSTSSSLDPTILIDQLNEICRWVEQQSGVRFDYERNAVADERQLDRERLVYKIRLYFADFAGQGQITLKIRLDVTTFDRLYLPSQERQLIHQYSDASLIPTTLRVVALEEALADKLKCVIQRSHAHDLFDLVYAIFIRNDIDVDRSTLVRVFLQKSIFGPSPLAAKRLLLDAPFDLARGFWSKVIVAAAERLDFDDTVSRFRTGVEELFAPYGDQPYGAAAFYPPELRTPIMEAGAKRQLVRMRYDGVTRLVEPYALTFKRRQDGAGQEYFYGYDRTGGLTGKTSIKMFVNTKIELLEVTDDPFEPRYEIELAKAGDSELSGYFGGGVAVTRARSSRTAVRVRRSDTVSDVARAVACSPAARAPQRCDPIRTRGATRAEAGEAI